MNLCTVPWIPPKVTVDGVPVSSLLLQISPEMLFIGDGGPHEHERFSKKENQLIETLVQ